MGAQSRFSLVTIRARLLAGFVIVVLLLAVFIGAGSIVIGYLNGKQQAVDRLQSVAALKEMQIREWSRSIQADLLVALNEEYARERASLVLKLAGDFRYSEYYFDAVRNRYARFLDQAGRLDAILLLDLEGRVVLSTDRALEGEGYAGHLFFTRGLQGGFTQLPFEGALQEEPFAVAAVPVAGPNGQPLGILAGRASLSTLNDIVSEQTGIGSTGKTYLVDANRRLLAAALSTRGRPDEGEASSSMTIIRDAHSTGIDAAIVDRNIGSAEYTDHLGVGVVGVYRWLPELDAALIVEQDQSEAYQAVLATLNVNVVVAVLAALGAAIASLVFTRGISAPLIDLVDTATRIAGGDLDRQAVVAREDEVGKLARAFNLMTAQLRDSISGLERRVAERTSALRRRALQLETSARVSREITSILDIDTLLNRVVELIQTAFNYYRVHIFLVDGEHLQLRASSGAVQPRHRRLSIGIGSLNGEAVQTNAALLVSDVTRDPRFLFDDALPDTRSELIIPLRAGERVIGTLDAQSVEANGFTPEDVLVIQSLGDQIAVAIENARLYDQSRALAVLEERNRLARELHDSVTQSLYGLVVFAGAGRDMLGAANREPLAKHLDRMERTAHQALKEMRWLLYELRPPLLEKIGLAGALQQRVSAVEQRAGMNAQVAVDCRATLPVDVEEGIFRIAQEALNNTLKHAQAKLVRVCVLADEERIRLEVADDGIGFEPDGASRRGGFGLAMMRERAEQLRGTLTIVSEPGQGTRVTFTRERPGESAGMNA